jgi:hypothetical protein
MITTSSVTRTAYPCAFRQVPPGGSRVWWACILLIGGTVLLPAVEPGADDLLVYPAVPGLPASTHYALRVRPAGSSKPWQPAFAWQTACQNKKGNNEKYFDHLAGWTHTYVNFETTVAVEVEIARADGVPIRSAAVHPRRHARAATVVGGKALITLDKPCQVAVDIDGQMDDQDTGKGYRGPPIHTVSIFANPPIVGRPRPDGPGVLAVKPGTIPPADGPWKTLYFLPGIHDLGAGFPVHANRQYYIPGDAVVFGTFNNSKNWKDGHHIRIFGYGTLSGERLKHPSHAVPKPKEDSFHNPIDIFGANDTSIEGITIADSAHHSLMLYSGKDPERPTDIRWVKIFTWRANGDGINPFGNGLLEDCFIRTQDDSTYVNGRGMRRLVLWNDANGSAFVLSAMPQLTDRTLVVEDCDVIYARAMWDKWAGGRVFNMRGEGGGACGAGVIFRNINVEDPRPTLQQFFITMATPVPYSKEGRIRKPGDLAGVLFQNISIAAPSVLGEPQLLWGQEDARIHHLTFDNLTVGGKRIGSADFFKTNAFVADLIFPPADAPGR